jgi:hypothetical protein
VLFQGNFQSWVALQRKIKSKIFTKTNVICHGYFCVDWVNVIDTLKSKFIYVFILSLKICKLD